MPVSAWRRHLVVRRVAWLRRAAATLRDWSDACQRASEGPPLEKGDSPSRRTKQSWRELLSQFSRPDVSEALFSRGLIGDDLPRTVGEPAGRRILVLAPHQDDETIGAGGTALLRADAGCTFEVIYYTDGATRLAQLDPSEVSRSRQEEAIRVWRRLAGVVPTFWGYPNRGTDLAPDAPSRLRDVIDRFQPDTILVPNFFEQPVEHRRLTDLLLAVHRDRPLDAAIEIWGYQVTTRLPGNRVVDVTAVIDRKYAINRLWATQNVYLDYAHLARGRDAANAYYLKGRGRARHAAAYAEVFLAFPAHEYLELADIVTWRAAAAAPPDFFVVGLQKSGSYWVTALLDAHPEIRCFPSRPGHQDGTGEAHFFDLLARIESDYPRFGKSMRAKLGGHFAPVVPKHAPASKEAAHALRQVLRDRFNQFCDAERRAANKRIVGEKTTESVHFPKLIEELYPGVRKVCILRDPRDRVVSFAFHEQRKGRRPAGAPIDADLVAQYIRRVRRDYEGLLAMPAPVHLLTYEALTLGPERVVTDLLNFLGVEASREVIGRMIEAAAFETMSGRPRGEASVASHFRRGVSGDWREHLHPEQEGAMVQALEDLTSTIERQFAIDLSAYRAFSLIPHMATSENPARP